MSVSVPDQDATRFSVASSAVDVQLFAATGRNGGRTVFNESSAILYIAFGAVAASLASYTVQVAPGGYYEFPPSKIFGGEVRAIWASANGNARCTEW
jgi:hypothetical protein